MQPLTKGMTLMDTLVIYYSYTGNAKKLAERLAKDNGAKLYEVRDQNRPGTFAAYTAGCFNAIRGKLTKIEPLSVNFEDFEKIIIVSPVWASNPPPAVNSVIDALPSGKYIDVYMVSASGRSGAKDKLRDKIEGKASELAKYEDVRAGTL